MCSAGHELGCRSETAQVASFNYDRDGTQETDPAKRQQFADHHYLGARLGVLVQRGLEALDAHAGRRHFSQVIGEHDLIRDVLELQLPQQLEAALRLVVAALRATA